MDNPTFLAGGGGNNWVGGIELKIDIFEGGAKRAELSRQRALEEKVVAMKQSASDAVRLEVRRAYYELIQSAADRSGTSGNCPGTGESAH